MPESTDIIGESLHCDIEKYKDNMMKLWNRKRIQCWKVMKWWKEEGWEVWPHLGKRISVVDAVLSDLQEVTDEDP